VKHDPRAPARSAVASALVALAVTVVLAGCGSAGTPHPVVALLPAPRGSSHVWRWTAHCPFRGPAANDGCSGAGPILGFAQLNGDEWNLGGPANAGSVDMSVGSADRTVRINGHFARTAPCTESTCLAPSAATWVRGYPNVLYGINQCYAGTSPSPSPRLPLPMRLDSIPAHLIGVTAYSAQTSQVTHDVTYDLWLHPTGTRRPCLSQGTLEILVWTDYNARALLPGSLEAGTANIPSAVDGVARPASPPWSVYASNIYRDGRTAPWGGTLWFVPPVADVVGHGRVNVDLSAVFSAAALLLHDNYGWAELTQHYWLDTASFGVEYGPASGNPTDSGPSHFSAQISAYCLDLRTTVQDAACG
jgi:Glycosyl hydrolase family 12